jgi:hypothetical protein
MVEKNPQTIQEAKSTKEWPKWKEAIDKELLAHEENGTWREATPPNRQKTVKTRWVFVKKYDKDGNVSKFKARLVAKGFTQKYGTDYLETFAPVVKFKSIRLLAAMWAALGLYAFQDDVPAAFLKGKLKENIWIEVPDGLENVRNGNKLKLVKTLYGLKQSPREWNAVLHEFLIESGFQQCVADPCIYIQGKNESLIIVGIYVDDIITLGKSDTLTNAFRTKLKTKFNVQQGGPLEWYLGMRFTHANGKVTIDQNSYIQAKLKLFEHLIGTGGVSHPLPTNLQEILNNAEDSGPADVSFPYRAMVGCLMYSMLGSRPDLTFALSIVSRFLDKPTNAHCDLVRHIFKYLRTNPHYCLEYAHGGKVELQGYVDASYAGDEGYRSTSGFGFLVANCLISWYSKRQTVIAQSSAEAEYYAASEAAREAIWLKTILRELGFPQGTVTLHEDNQACIALSKNPEDHKRTKHIQVKYHLIRQYVKDKEIELKYCPTATQWADLFTKSLPGHKLRSILPHLSVRLMDQGENQKSGSKGT